MGVNVDDAGENKYEWDGTTSDIGWVDAGISVADMRKSSGIVMKHRDGDTWDGVEFEDVASGNIRMTATCKKLDTECECTELLSGERKTRVTIVNKKTGDEYIFVFDFTFRHNEVGWDKITSSNMFLYAVAKVLGIGAEAKKIISNIKEIGFVGNGFESWYELKYIGNTSEQSYY